MIENFTIIAAATPNKGIGLNGKLPWKNSTDMKYFKNITTLRMNEEKQNVIIMGKNTLKSLNFKPLYGRINICITSDEELLENDNDYDILFFSSLNESFKYLGRFNERIETIFIIGGGMLYKEAIQHPNCKEILLNIINTDIDCDTFFPEIDDNQFKLMESCKLSDDVTNYRYVKREHKGIL